jgi:hypothetical protein
MPTRSSMLREGAFTGLLGGSAVSLWFLVVDLIAGTPLFTPSTLGAALFGFQPIPTGWGWVMLLVAGYTVFHYAAFVLVGVGAALLLLLAEREPALLVLLFLLFEVLEVGFYGLVAILHETRLLRGLAWYQIAGGNLVASGVMGSHLWHAHPALRFRLGPSLSH